MCPYRAKSGWFQPQNANSRKYIHKIVQMGDMVEGEVVDLSSIWMTNQQSDLPVLSFELSIRIKITPPAFSNHSRLQAPH